MIGKFNHVAIVVPDIDAARIIYRDTLGAKVTATENYPDHGVRVVFVELPNTTIELMTPLGENSPVANFLKRNPVGGIHHICLEVENIMEARNRLRAEGVRILGDGEPTTSAQGKPVLFVHPKDFCGTLIEIEEA
jgi:methylmalonyl-CoA/ethylmalonyl-CoA epimerase